MTVDIHTTRVEVDVSQALAAEERLKAATAGRVAAAHELAAVQSKHEREQIDALKATENELKRALGLRREERAEARAALQAATQEQQQARDGVRAQMALQRDQAGQARAALKDQIDLERAAAAIAQQQAAAARAALKDQIDLERAASDIAQQRAGVMRREADEIEHHGKLIRMYGGEEAATARAMDAALVRRIQAERVVGDEVQARRLEMQRELVTAEQLLAAERKRSDAAVTKVFGGEARPDDMERFRGPVDATKEWAGSLGNVKAGFLSIGSAVGGVVTGIQSALALGREAISFVDETVNESFEVQSIARNLQIDISQARAALGGMVADKELALAANKAVAMGVADTGEKFAHIAEMVAQQAVKLGKDQTQLINDYVEAVGKQEAEIFDNLGLTLRLTDAYDIYAEQLGKTAKELTKTEKAEAFNAAALSELERATGKAAVKVDGFAESWRQGTVSWKNFRSEVLGFDDVAGKVNEALRRMSDEEIDRIGRWEKDIVNHGSRLDDINGRLGEWGITLDDLRRISDEQGVSLDTMLSNAIEAHEVLFQKTKQRIAEEQQLQTIQQLNTESADLDHAAKLLEVMGGKKKDVLALEIQSLETQYFALQTQAELTRSAEDEAKARKLLQGIEIKRAQIEMGTVKKGGKKRNPNEALDLQTAATLRLIKSEETLIKSSNDVRRSEAERFDLENQLLDLAVRELDVREAALALRVTKTAADKDKAAAEQLAIVTERTVTASERLALAREQERGAIEQRIEALGREIEIQDRLGASTELLERQRLQAQTQLTERYGDAAERDALAHTLALQRADERNAARTAGAEADLAAYEQDVQRREAAGSQEQDLGARRIELEIALAQAAGDTDNVRQLYHEREVDRIQREVAVRERALGATRQGLQQGMQLFSLVADAAIKDERKRERAMMRARGVEAMVTGALETVQAVASFASFNFIQGALHTAAAAVAYGTGISLLAGKVPAKGGAASPAGGGAGHEVQLSEGSGVSGGGDSRGVPAVPPSAEELIRLRGGQTGTTQTTASKGGGGNVYNIGAIVSADAGTIIQDTAEGQARKWGTA